ncbi:MAG: LD-carboxypeptidase [Rhodoferax sp.]|nr:LD-carboxypeptidase [Rhodoferax sp.]
MDRRAFSQWVMAAGLMATGVPAIAAPTRPRLRKPRRLREGACIGVVSPGGLMEAEALEKCVRKVEALGFKVRLGDNVLARHGHKAGTVAHRVADLHTMFADDSVDAIWTTRGGYGSSALLPHLDYALIRRKPKILIGYSDITALHLGIYQHTGLVTFHGPVLWSSFSDYSLEHIRKILMEPAPRYEMALSADNLAKGASNPAYIPRTLHAGVAEGPLLGGNLSVLCNLLGTRHMPALQKHLLFLEEITETPKKIDRMLTQLRLTPGFDSLTGVVCGVFDDCIPTDTDPTQTLDEVLDENFAAFSKPVVYGYSFGHVSRQYTLPQGIRARLDTEAQTLTLLEAAVI